MGITIAEEEFAEFGQRDTKLVITAPLALMPAMTNWLDATDTGRLVEMMFIDEDDAGN